MKRITVFLIVALLFLPCAGLFATPAPMESAGQIKVAATVAAPVTLDVPTILAALALVFAGTLIELVFRPIVLRRKMGRRALRPVFRPGHAQI